jgi:hypothetical protein
MHAHTNTLAHTHIHTHAHTHTLVQFEKLLYTYSSQATPHGCALCNIHGHACTLARTHTGHLHHRSRGSVCPILQHSHVHTQATYTTARVGLFAQFSITCTYTHRPPTPPLAWVCLPNSPTLARTHTGHLHHRSHGSVCPILQHAQGYEQWREPAPVAESRSR